MSRAHYFHFTIHRFSPEARQLVISKFKTQVRNALVDCWYNAHEEGFFLTAPSGEDAVKANDAMHEIVKSYDENETIAATSENRPAKIRNFPESSFDSMVSFYDERDQHEQLTNIAIELELQTDDLQPMTFYGVRLKRSRGQETPLKLFKLRELPEGSLERSLAPAHGASKSLRTGLTLRTVRYDQYRGELVFNGRVHVPLDNFTFDSAHFEKLASRNVFQFCNDRDYSDAVLNQTIRMNPSKATTTTEYGVRQFIDAVEPSNLIDVDERPEMPPSDARNFLAQPSYQTVALGRMRVAKGASSLPPADDVDNDDTTTTKSTPGPSFANLLASRNAAAAPSSANVFDPPSVDTASSPKPRSFSNLLATSRQREPVSRDSAEASQPEMLFNNLLASNKARAVESLKSARLAGNDKDNPSPSTNHEIQVRSSTASLNDRSNCDFLGPADSYESWRPHDRRSFADFGPGYARLDTVGLTSNATKQAQWEHNNPSPRKPKGLKDGIRKREIFKSSSSAALPNASMEKENLTNLPTDFTQPQNLRSPECKPEVHNNVSSRANSLGLDKRPEARRANVVIANNRSEVRVHLGLEMGSRQDTQSDNRKRIGSQSLNSQLCARPRTNRYDALADLDSIESEDPTSVEAKESEHGRAKKSSTFAQKSQGQRNAILDLPVESLQPTLPVQQKKFTMRQQAPNKRKNKPKPKPKPKQQMNTDNNPKAQLPLPDYLPPPRKQMQANRPGREQAIDGHPSFNGPSTSDGKTLQPMEEMTMPQAERRSAELVAPSAVLYTEEQSKLVKYNNDIAGFLKTALPKASQWIQLDVQFGYALLRHEEKNFADESQKLNASQFCRKLHEAGEKVKTDFYPRMWTTIPEAAFIISLIGGTPKIDQYCEEIDIQVKLEDGTSRIIRITRLDKPGEEYTVIYADCNVARLIAQYPNHVWDAQIGLRLTVGDPVFGQSEVVRTFIKSIAPNTNLPSGSIVFRVPAEVFTVEHVYQRQIYRKASGKIDLQVSRVWECELCEIEASFGQNVCALMLSEEESIGTQRMWGECKLNIPNVVDLQPNEVERLQSTVDDMMEKLDHVGYHNQGPFVSSEMPENKDSEAEIPFW